MRRYCSTCHKLVPKKGGARGNCKSCYEKLKSRGRLPPLGAQFLTEPPVPAQGSTTLEPYSDEDDSPFEDATTERPRPLQVIEILEGLSGAGGFELDLLTVCCEELRKIHGLEKN